MLLEVQCEVSTVIDDLCWVVYPTLPMGYHLAIHHRESMTYCQEENEKQETKRKCR